MMSGLVNNDEIGPIADGPPAPELPKVRPDSGPAPTPPDQRPSPPKSQPPSDPPTVDWDEKDGPILVGVGPGKTGPGDFTEIKIEKVGQPLIKLATTYPESCRSKNIEGNVVIRYDVTKNGQVINATIISSPHKCFNRSALRTVENWKYSASGEGGNGIAYSGVMTTFTFSLTD